MMKMTWLSVDGWIDMDMQCNLTIDDEALESGAPVCED